MHSGWRKRARLARRAEIIQLMDAAIKKEGGAENLTFDELKWVSQFTAFFMVWQTNKQDTVVSPDNVFERELNAERYFGERYYEMQLY